MEAFCDGGGIDEEATAKTTTNVGVELIEGNLRLQEGKQISQTKHLNITYDRNVLSW